MILKTRQLILNFLLQLSEETHQGSFEKVSQALGRNWFMEGKIIKGNQKARLINFPTANMKPKSFCQRIVLC